MRVLAYDNEQRSKPSNIDITLRFTWLQAGGAGTNCEQKYILHWIPGVTENIALLDLDDRILDSGSILPANDHVPAVSR